MGGEGYGGYPIPDDESVKRAFEELESAEDFLARTAQTAIEVAMATYRSADIYGPNYHAYKEVAQPSSDIVWAGQSNSAL